MTLFPFTLDRKRLTETGYEIRLPSLSPGAANPYSSCFHKALWRGQRYLVWGCGTGIVVYSDSNYNYEDVSRRPFAKRLEIRAVCMSSETGLIASSDSEQLRIHQAPTEKNNVWPVVAYELQPSINCMAWSYQDTLITAGDGLTLWSVKRVDEKSTVELKVVWKTLCLGTPINAIIATNYSTIFATLGSNSRLVKVWYGDADKIAYRFSYLSHPRSVTNAIWRDRTIPSLVTLCVDGFSRVWTAQSPDSFYITNVIDVTGTGVWPTIPPASGRRIISWTDCSEGQVLALDSDQASDSSFHCDMQVDAILIEYTDASELVAWAMLYDDDGNASLQSTPLIIGRIHLEDRLKSLDSCVIRSANDHDDISLALMTPAGDIYRISFGKLNCPDPTLTSIASGNRRAITTMAIQPPYITTKTQDNSIACLMAKTGQKMLEPVWQAANITNANWVCGSNTLLSIEQEMVLAYTFDSDHITRIHIPVPDSLSLIQSVNGVLLAKSASTTATMSTEIWIVALTGKYGANYTILKRDGIAIIQHSSTDIPNAHAIHVVRQQYNGHQPSNAYCAAACMDGRVLVYLVDEQGNNTSLGQFEIVSLTKAQNIHIYMNSSGIIALDYTINHNTTVEIWSQDKLSNQWKQVYTYSMKPETPLLDIYWQQNDAISTDILIISTCSGLNIVASVRAINSAYTREWRMIGSIPMSQQCSARFYGNDTTLIKTESCRVSTIMDIWPEVHWNFSHSSQRRSLSEILVIINAEMPLYHPELIKFMIREADFERVRIAIHIIEEMVRHSDKYDEYLASDNKICQCLRPVYNFSDTLPIAKEAAQYLVKDLEQFQLPGLLASEQQTLCTLISVTAEMTDWLRSLDAVGVRFAMAVRLATINKDQAASAKESLKFSYRELSWAYYSLGQDSLFKFCQSFCNLTMDWPTVAALGIPMWLKDTNMLKGLLLKMARDRFGVSKDPMDATLFFLALRKKILLLGLWRTTSFHPEQAKMLKFLAQDFDDPRKQSAALKNAFALLGKRRYELAAAFFLLADRPKDAVSVCIKHLQDIQLAICICRVYEGDDSVVLRELYVMLAGLPSLELQHVSSEKDVTWLKSVIAFASDDRIKAMNILVNAIMEDSQHADPSFYPVIEHLRVTHRLPLPDSIQEQLQAWYLGMEQQAYRTLL